MECQTLPTQPDRQGDIEDECRQIDDPKPGSVAARQATARRVLQGLEFQAHPEGHHLWLTLPERWRRADLNVHARQSGLALVPSEAFAIGSAPDSIRVSLGAAQNRAALERGLSVLTTVLSHGPSALSSIV
jgi:DNA-binding transcriptional MocR family regulator